MSTNDTLSYDIFVSGPIPLNVTGLLPIGERYIFPPLSTTLIYGKNDAVLVDPPLTIDQAKRVGQVLSAIEAARDEVIADDLTRRVKAGLSNEVGIYLNYDPDRAAAAAA
jgi:hypothetical protein